MIRRVDSVVGVELDILYVVAERRMLSKLFLVLVNTSHYTLCCWTEEHVQPKSDQHQVFHRAPQQILLVCGYQTVEHVTQLQRAGKLTIVNIRIFYYIFVVNSLWTCIIDLLSSI